MTSSTAYGRWPWWLQKSSPQTRDELIARVAEQYDVLGPCLIWLAHAGDDVRAVLDTITAAEARLAVALANVEGDEDAQNPMVEP